MIKKYTRVPLNFGNALLRPIRKSIGFTAKFTAHGMEDPRTSPWTSNDLNPEWNRENPNFVTFALPKPREFDTVFFEVSLVGVEPDLFHMEWLQSLWVGWGFSANPEIGNLWFRDKVSAMKPIFMRNQGHILKDLVLKLTESGSSEEFDRYAAVIKDVADVCRSEPTRQIDRHIDFLPRRQVYEEMIDHRRRARKITSGERVSIYMEHAIHPRPHEEISVDFRIHGISYDPA